MDTNERLVDAEMLRVGVMRAMLGTCARAPAASSLGGTRAVQSARLSTHSPASACPLDSRGARWGRGLFAGGLCGAALALGTRPRSVKADAGSNANLTPEQQQGFWSERWQKGETQFHLSSVNDTLLAYSDFFLGGAGVEKHVRE